MPNLTAKEHLFVTEYVKHGIGSKAVIAAGYSESGASVTANRLLKRAHVAAEIARQRRPIEKNAESLVDKLMREVVALATVDPADIWTNDGKLKPLNEIPDHARRAIASISDKGIKLNSKLGALELAAKITGMVKQEQVSQAAVQIIIGEPAKAIEVSAERAQLLPEW